LFGRGGGARGGKIRGGGNGASVSPRSVAFFEIFRGVCFGARKKNKTNWREIYPLDPLVVILGCGPIRMGEGAAAPFIGVHILCEIRLAGGLIPWPNRDGRTELDRLSRSNKSTIPQSTVGGLFMFGESAVGWNGGPVCGDRNWGEYSTLKGGGRHVYYVMHY